MKFAFLYPECVTSIFFAFTLIPFYYGMGEVDQKNLAGPPHCWFLKIASAIQQ